MIRYLRLREFLHKKQSHQKSSPNKCMENCYLCQLYSIETIYHQKNGCFRTLWKHSGKNINNLQCLVSQNKMTSFRNVRRVFSFLCSFCSICLFLFLCIYTLFIEDIVQRELETTDRHGFCLICPDKCNYSMQYLCKCILLFSCQSL